MINRKNPIQKITDLIFGEVKEMRKQIATLDEQIRKLAKAQGKEKKTKDKDATTNGGRN